MKAKAYMDGRVKLLESGAKVINENGGSNTKKWMVKAETKGYNAGKDFVEKGESKKKRKRSE